MKGINAVLCDEGKTCREWQWNKKSFVEHWKSHEKLIYQVGVKRISQTGKTIRKEIPIN